MQDDAHFLAWILLDSVPTLALSLRGNVALARQRSAPSHEALSPAPGTQDTLHTPPPSPLERTCPSFSKGAQEGLEWLCLFHRQETRGRNRQQGSWSLV